MNNRTWYVLGSLLSITFFATMSGFFIYEEINGTKVIAETEEVQPPTKTDAIQFEPKTVEVILQRVYLDGEVSEEYIEETIWSMEDFWANYDGWSLVDQNESQVIFQQEINDISPLLKINGYFGLSSEGFLNIYEGKPTEEKVIHSFFQINTKKLKSHQQTELQEGIPVLSRDHYEKVIQNMKKYAIYEF